MEYPSAFRLQDNHPVNMISSTWQNMIIFFKGVWYGDRGSTQNWLNSVFYSIQEIETKSPKAIIVANCANTSLTGKTRQDLHVHKVMPSRGWTRQESLHLYHFNFPAKKEYLKK